MLLDPVKYGSPVAPRAGLFPLASTSVGPFSFFALITNALSQRCEVIFRQRHRDAWTVWPSPEIADHTADETLSKAVDLDARRIAVRAGHAGFFGGFPKRLLQGEAC